MSRLKVFIVLLIVVLGLATYYWKPIQQNLEGGAPSISFRASPEALGVTDSTITIEVSDAPAGIAAVSAALRQGDSEHILLDKHYDGRPRQETLTFSIPNDVLSSLRDGSAEIFVTASDKSMRHNQSVVSIRIPIDQTLPQLSLLSLQFIAQQGGSESVVFEAKDNALRDVGVMVGDRFFRAVPARDLDQRFDALPDVYIALFAFPFDFDISSERLSVFARDKGNNESQVPFRLKLIPYKQPITTPSLSSEFLQRKVPELLLGYRKLSKEDPNLDLDSTEGLLKGFRLVNEEYRTLLNQRLEEIYARVTPAKPWTKDFLRPIAGATSSNFGEKRTYMYEGKEISKSEHLGLDLASVQRDEVHAPNDGTVVFISPFGIYGNTVIIDHGLGLFSLVCHLSSIAVEVGDRVSRGDILGRTGETGLAGGDHLHFELRLGGLPVNPREWWDAKWIRDHLTGKLDATYDVLAPNLDAN